MTSFNVQTKQTSGKGYVRYFFKDSITGKEIDSIRIPTFTPNSPTALTKIVSAHCLSGDPAYAVTHIEWGVGNTGINTTDPENPDLSSPLSPTGILTPVSIEFTSNPGEVKFTSALTDAYYPGATNIWEVGLRTSALIGNGSLASPQYPKGMLAAYFQNSSSVPKSVGSVVLGVQWLFVYTSTN